MNAVLSAGRPSCCAPLQRSLQRNAPLSYNYDCNYCCYYYSLSLSLVAALVAAQRAPLHPSLRGIHASSCLAVSCLLHALLPFDIARHLGTLTHIHASRILVRSLHPRACFHCRHIFSLPPSIASSSPSLSPTTHTRARSRAHTHAHRKLIVRWRRCKLHTSASVTSLAGERAVCLSCSCSCSRRVPIL